MKMDKENRIPDVDPRDVLLNPPAKPTKDVPITHENTSGVMLKALVP